MGRPKKQQNMTETASAETAAPQTLELEKCCELVAYKEKALALVATDNTIHIIPCRNVNKVSTQSPGNPTSVVNGLLVKHKLENILDVLEWDIKKIEATDII